MQSFLPEAALADLAYNQALMFQLLQRNPSATALSAAQNPLANAQAAVAAAQSNAAASAGLLNPNGNGISTPSMPSKGSATQSPSGVSSAAGLESDFGLSPDSFEPPVETDLYPTQLYSCLICANFNSNHIDELNQHLLVDRSRTHTHNHQDIMLHLNNIHICRLCDYKTPLKANFQLHSKTDKHIQKLNYINHIKEGGVTNEYKLKYNSNNTVQLKCNCCDYYTNSIQKLNLHAQNVRHENMKMVFNHLVETMATVSAQNETPAALRHGKADARRFKRDECDTNEASDNATETNDDDMDANERGVTQNSTQDDDQQDTKSETSTPTTTTTTTTTNQISVKSADEINDTAKDTNSINNNNDNRNNNDKSSGTTAIR